MKGPGFLWLFHVQYRVGGRMGDTLEDAAGPANLHMIDPGLGAKAEVGAAIAGGHEAHAGGNVVIESAAGSGHDLD